MKVMSGINGLVPAAGMSSRMGVFKPMMPLRGKTIIENALDSMLSAGVEQIVVVLGYRGQELETLLRSRYPGARLLFTYNRRYAETDMLDSIKEGLSTMPTCSAFFLLPADMPVVDKQTYRAVYRALPQEGESIVFPTFNGYRKHPPLICSRFIPDILTFDSTDGLRGFWRLNEKHVVTVSVDDIGCCTDLDTRQQYERCVNAFQKLK